MMSSPQSYRDQLAALGVEVRTAEGGRYRSVPVATIPAARRRWVGASFDTAGLTLFAAIATAIRPALPIFTPTTQKKDRQLAVTKPRSLYEHSLDTDLSPADLVTRY